MTTDSPGDESVTTTKATWRDRILAGRRELAAATRAAEARQLARSVVDLVTSEMTVCAYVPVGTEPGTIEFVNVLHSTGARVLLPVAREPGPLRWARFTGVDNLVRAPYGLEEPGGACEPPEEIASASTIFVPALAVDTSGNRLGRGAGFYDRSLPLANPTADLITIVRAAEIVDALPSDPHDVPMTHALTAERGLLRLTADSARSIGR